MMAFLLLFILTSSGLSSLSNHHAAKPLQEMRIYESVLQGQSHRVALL